MGILGDVVGGILGPIGQWFSAQEQRKQESTIAENQMAFQDRMSGTAYQRAVADMKAAGLNPMLAYQQGGASTPSGATYSPESLGKDAITSAVDYMRMRQEIAESKSRVKANLATKFNQESQERLNNALSEGKELENKPLFNRVEMEMKHPKLFGFWDAYMRRILPAVDTGAGFLPSVMKK